MKKRVIACTMAASLLFSGVIFAENTAATTAQQPVSEAVKNQQAGEAFLKANAKKEGVVVLPDGLQYKVIKNGAGKKPTADDNVTVHYSGNTIDGKVFDSSYKRGVPATFPVRGVIPGWTEALQLMPEGSTWMLYIPSDLAYGRIGMPPVIGPNQVLVFKVQLLAIK